MIAAPLWWVLALSAEQPSVAVSVAGCAPADTTELLRLLTLELRDVEGWAGANSLQIVCRGPEAIVTVTGEGGRARAAPLPLDDALAGPARAARLRELVLLGGELHRSLATMPPPPVTPPSVAGAPAPPRPPRVDVGALVTGAAYGGGLAHGGPELMLQLALTPRWRVEARLALRWGVPASAPDGRVAHSALEVAAGAAVRALARPRLSLDLAARVGMHEVFARGQASADDARTEGQAARGTAVVALVGPALRVALGHSWHLVAEVAYAQPLVPVALRDGGSDVIAMSGPGVSAGVGLARAF